MPVISIRIVNNNFGWIDFNKIELIRVMLLPYHGPLKPCGKIVYIKSYRNFSKQNK